MHVDALTLAALADEFSRDLLGARIEDVIQPTPQSVAFHCWGNGRTSWLIASAHPQLARVHLAEAKPRKLIAEPPAFVMLLRKHLEGARISAIAQPPWERLLQIGFARGPLEAGSAQVWLVVEVMGPLSNLILREDTGAILGALRIVTAEVNRYRVIQPHVEYTPPPPQTRTLEGVIVPRLLPGRVTPADLIVAARGALELAQSATPMPSGKRQKREALTVASLLSTHVAGFSREMGREVAARALGAPDAALQGALPWDALADAIHALAQLPNRHAWRPTLVYPDADATLPSAFAVYEPRQFAGATLRLATSVNAMLATYFAGAEWRAAIDGAKADLRSVLQTHRERTIRKQEALKEDMRALDEARQLREEADLLLAFQTDVPPHASRVTLENPFAADGATTATLTLDPRLTAVENANKRYARYHKLQRATKLIPPQLAAAALELARIEQLRTDLALADTLDDITHVRREVIEAGYVRGKAALTHDKRQGKQSKQPKKGKAGQPAKRVVVGGAPLRRQSSDEFAMLVGKNGHQNEEVTFHQASGNDLWLHARGVPGAHVIVRSGGRPVPERTVREAAALAAYYSQARENGSVLVDYTEQRYVRHLKGGGPGMVNYERERTVRVSPEDVGIGVT